MIEAMITGQPRSAVPLAMRCRLTDCLEPTMRVVIVGLAFA
jgi:hypothetical protein